MGSWHSRDKALGQLGSLGILFLADGLGHSVQLVLEGHAQLIRNLHLFDRGINLFSAFLALSDDFTICLGASRAFEGGRFRGEAEANGFGSVVTTKLTLGICDHEASKAVFTVSISPFV